MDLFQALLSSNIGVGAAIVAGALVAREAVGLVICVWAMLTKKPEKEQLALAILCFVWPRRGERLRSRLASIKAQIPRPRKPRVEQLPAAQDAPPADEESKAADPETASSTT